MSKFLFYLLSLLFVIFLALPVINKDAVIPPNLKPEEVANFLSHLINYWVKVFQALNFKLS